LFGAGQGAVAVAGRFECVAYGRDLRVSACGARLAGVAAGVGHPGVAAVAGQPAAYGTGVDVGAVCRVRSAHFA